MTTANKTKQKLVMNARNIHSNSAREREKEKKNDKASTFEIRVRIDWLIKQRILVNRCAILCSNRNSLHLKHSLRFNAADARICVLDEPNQTKEKVEKKVCALLTQHSIWNEHIWDRNISVNWVHCSWQASLAKDKCLHCLFLSWRRLSGSEIQ